MLVAVNRGHRRNVQERAVGAFKLGERVQQRSDQRSPTSYCTFLQISFLRRKPDTTIENLLGLSVGTAAAGVTVIYSYIRIIRTRNTDRESTRKKTPKTLERSLELETPSFQPFCQITTFV